MSQKGLENNSFTFNQDKLVNVPIKCKQSKQILIQVTNNIHYIYFSGKMIVYLISSKPVESSNSILTAN